MIALAEALGAALLHFLWQGVLLMFLLWVVLLMLGRSSAGVRYMVSCAALLALALLPVVTTYGLYARPGVARTGADLLPAVTGALSMGWPSPDGQPAAWLDSLRWWALRLWSVGAVLFSLRLAWACRHVSVLRRLGEPAAGPVLAVATALAARIGLTRPLRVLISSIAEGPGVVGWIQPVVLVPVATLLGLTPRQLEAVLAHEIAHIRRYDHVVNMAQAVVETLLFYHPAVWWTSARIRHERELCCDDLAVRSCGDALCYARALAKLERLRLPAPELALNSTGGPLSYRIRRLTGATTRQYGVSKLPALLALCLALACFTVNLKWAHGQTVSDWPGVRVDMAGTAVLHRTPIVYPEAALKKGVEGTVVLEVALDGNGNVTDARVLGGPDGLRKAALESVLTWHFTRDTAQATRQVAIVFQLPPKVEKAAPVPAVKPDSSVGEAVTSEPPKAQARANERTEERAAKMPEERRRLEEEIRAARDQQGALSNREAEERLKELEHKLLLSRDPDYESRPRPEPLVTIEGRIVKTIEVAGLPDQLRNDLLSRLPVREGDTLSHKSIEAIVLVMHEFDEHLALQALPLDNGGAVLRILTPNNRK